MRVLDEGDDGVVMDALHQQVPIVVHHPVLLGRPQCACQRLKDIVGGVKEGSKGDLVLL